MFILVGIWDRFMKITILKGMWIQRATFYQSEILWYKCPTPMTFQYFISFQLKVPALINIFYIADAL